MSNSYPAATGPRRGSHTSPRRAQTDGIDPTRKSHEGVSRRLHRHRQTISHGAPDPPRNRKHHAYSKSHGHHHIADGIRMTVPEQYQQFATQNDKREQGQRPGIQREDNIPRVEPGDGSTREEQERAQGIIITSEDVAKERRKQKARDEELLNTLHQLSEHSLTTTRRLDDTYYSILERVGHLHSTINSLQELSNRTKDLCRNFENESEEISNDISGQTEHFGGFDEQRATIGKLEARISSGQERSVKLGERLHKCRERLTWVEKRDAEEVKRRARFYQGLWSTLGIVGCILLLLLVIHYLKVSHPHFQNQASVLEDLPRELNKSKGRLPPAVEEILAEIKRDREKTCKNEVHLDRRKEDEKTVKRLRIFDEL